MVPNGSTGIVPEIRHYSIGTIVKPSLHHGETLTVPGPQMIDSVLHSIETGDLLIARAGCTHVTHTRGRMAVACRTLDPRILTMAGRSTSGFHRPGTHHVHQVRRAVRCSVSRVKGGLHPATNHA